MSEPTTYTDVSAFKRDFWPVKDVEGDDLIIRRAAVFSYNVVNSKLALCYSVPFAVTYPPMIVDISDLFTKGFSLLLKTRRGMMRIENKPKMQTVKEGELAMANEMLRALIMRECELLDSTGGIVPRLSDTDPLHTMDEYQPIFDLDHPIFHRVDDDYLDVVEDRRDD